SGNSGDGVAITAGASSNLVLGNLIGLDRAGLGPLGNGTNGVTIDGSPANQIGGESSEARNVIAANRRSGIPMINAGATGNGISVVGPATGRIAVQGNFIGTDVTGARPLGNSQDGVFLNNSADNLIGGTEVGAGNVLAANSGSGIHLSGLGARGNAVLGNRIG